MTLLAFALSFARREPGAERPFPWLLAAALAGALVLFAMEVLSE